MTTIFERVYNLSTKERKKWFFILIFVIFGLNMFFWGINSTVLQKRSNNYVFLRNLVGTNHESSLDTIPGLVIHLGPGVTIQVPWPVYPVLFVFVFWGQFIRDLWDLWDLLVAPIHLYKRFCPSVVRSVRPQRSSVKGLSVCLSVRFASETKKTSWRNFAAGLSNNTFRMQTVLYHF